ncbi:MAG: dihydroorotate dehydrogenase electron transfer subunit [Rhodospirillaceae bacterium]|nr:dihydroorotate dehydrogenase electron transfer subunit [Rhodospirillaceae bacterium]
MSSGINRNTINLEEAVILSQQSFEGNQYIVRAYSPKCASRAKPGNFVHLTCDTSISMRRPLSIMRSDSQNGWLEFLYKPIGAGLELLTQKVKGDKLSLLGPIGNNFINKITRPLILALGGGVGIPPMIFLAETLQNDERFKMLVLMGSEAPFPFKLTDAKILVSGIPSIASYSVDMLEKWGIPSRAASNSGYSGCFQGHVTELARHWIQNLSLNQQKKVQLLGCGPTPMLEATAALAKEFNLPCQLAIEEFMACGVGGCAGCTVLLNTNEGPTMKRVCVDGPIFDAYQLYG